jgi:beta-lactamase superfamily II metal-dependent hydrolase
MGFEIDFLPVGEGEKSGDAIAIRHGNLHGTRSEQFVMVIDGGTIDSGDALVEHVQQVYRADSVDLVVSSHPDADHASGLTRLLGELKIGRMWMHRPWEHSADIRHMFSDGTLSNDRLSDKMRRALSNAWNLDKIARRRGIPVSEPFSDGEVNGQYPFLRVLGSTERYYQSLLPGFRDMPESRDAVADLLRSGFGAFVKGAVATVAERVLERWDVETLVEPEDDATSSENNSSAVILLQIEGKDFLFTSDAGVPALERAVGMAELLGVNLPSCRFQQVPHHGSKRNVGPRLLDRLAGPRLPASGLENKSVFVSAAKEGEPKHPAKKVVNAYMRRGARVLATQGVGISLSEGAPARQGWGPATPLSFSYEVEDE